MEEAYITLKVDQHGPWTGIGGLRSIHNRELAKAAEKLKPEEIVYIAHRCNLSGSDGVIVKFPNLSVRPTSNWEENVKTFVANLISNPRSEFGHFNPKVTIHFSSGNGYMLEKKNSF